LIVDALFGFSFDGPSREPFTTIIEKMSKSVIPVISIDIPSGWNVDKGDIFHSNFKPNAVVSLTLPKLCMRNYTGLHYLGGRFVPPMLANQLDLVLPNYGKGDKQFVLLNDYEDNKFEHNELDTDINSPERQLLSQSESRVAVLFATASSEEEAQRISRALVEKKLVACVNIIPNVMSIYEWEGKLEESKEYLLMIKTRKALTEAVTEEIKKLHSYTVPETIALNIFGGNAAYIDWVKKSTTATK